MKKTKRTYIHPEMFDLIDNYRNKMNSKIKDLGLETEMSRIEASKHLALEIRKNRLLNKTKLNKKKERKKYKLEFADEPFRF